MLYFIIIIVLLYGLYIVWINLYYSFKENKEIAVFFSYHKSGVINRKKHPIRFRIAQFINIIKLLFIVFFIYISIIHILKK